MFFREKLKTSRPLVGMLLSLPSADIAEALSRTPLDWLFIDLEHTSISFGQAKAMLQAMKPECLSFIRIPDQQESFVKQALDMGASGIIVPLVNSAEEARRAVDWAKYPPQGKRSVGIARAHGYGKDFAGYVEGANHATSVIVQIEHVRAVENIDAILSVEGIDGIFIGPYDLSASFGIPGQIGDAKVQDAIRKVKAKARAKGVPVGIFSGNAEAAKKELESGVDFIAVGIDIMQLIAYAENLCRDMKPQAQSAKAG